MARYEVHICDATGCGVVARTNSVEAAKRRLARMVRQRAKSKFGREKAPDGRVYGQVKEVIHGVVADTPIYEAEERYGAPSVKVRRRRAPASTEE